MSRVKILNNILKYKCTRVFRLVIRFISVVYDKRTTANTIYIILNNFLKFQGLIFV